MTVIFELLLGRPGEDHQVPWILNRQRPEHHGINDTENGGISTNAERKNQYNSQGKSRRPSELTQSKTKVLQQPFERRPSPHFVRLLANQRRIAKRAKSGIPNLFR